MLDFGGSCLLLQKVAIELYFGGDIQFFLQHFSSLLIQKVNVKRPSVFFHSGNEFVERSLQKQSQLNLHRARTPPHIISILLTKLIRHLDLIFVLDEQDDHGFFLLDWPFTFVFLAGCLLRLQNIHERTLDYLDDRFVELECVLELHLQLFVVVAVDELVEGLELLRISVAQPIFDLCQLGSDGSLLVPVQPLDLYVALIPQKVDDFIDSLIVNSLHNAAISFCFHFGILLRNIMIIDSMLTKRKSNILPLLIFLFLLLLGNVTDPFGFARRVDNRPILFVFELLCLHFDSLREGLFGLRRQFNSVCVLVDDIQNLFGNKCNVFESILIRKQNLDISFDQFLNLAGKRFIRIPIGL